MEHLRDEEDLRWPLREMFEIGLELELAFFVESIADKDDAMPDFDVVKLRNEVDSVLRGVEKEDLVFELQNFLLGLGFLKLRLDGFLNGVYVVLLAFHTIFIYYKNSIWYLKK